MRLVVDASVLSPPLSGVGIYTHEILSRLPADWHIDRRGQAVASTRRRLLRRIPGAYRLRQARLALPLTRDVFWAPNFVAPRVLGPTIVTVHDLIFREHPEWADLTRGAFLRGALDASLDRAAAIVVSTEQDKAALGRPDKTHVIPPGIRELKPQVVAVGAPFVVAGNLEPRKDPWTVLKAHRSLPAASRREHPLLFVGAALDTAYAEAFLSALDPPCSRWLGRIDDAALGGLFAAARAVIAPSLAEGFGFVPLEAYAAGAPVIARDGLVTRELLGDRIRYFRDHEALAALMQAELPTPVDRASLLARYSWQAAADRYAALIRKCAA